MQIYFLFCFRPGIYEHEVTRNRHVTWPQQFGKPIHPIEPHLERKTIKTEVCVNTYLYDILKHLFAIFGHLYPQLIFARYKC